MNYNVLIKKENGQTIQSPEMCNLSKKAAIRMAKEMSTGENQVFIEWFRSSDGQRGYLNSDGNHAIIGNAW